MAELLQSCIRQKRQASFKKTCFALKDDICNESIQSPYTSTCSVVGEDCQPESPSKEPPPTSSSECALVPEESIPESQSKPTTNIQYVKKRLKENKGEKF